MLENLMGPFNDPEVIYYMTKKVPGLRVHLDVGHAHIHSKRAIEEYFGLMKSKIVHVHVSDNHGNSDEHLPLGVGTIDWEYITNILKVYKYNKTITFEIHADDRDYLLLSMKKFKELI